MEMAASSCRVNHRGIAWRGKTLSYNSETQGSAEQVPTVDIFTWRRRQIQPPINEAGFLLWQAMSNVRYFSHAHFNIPWSGSLKGAGRCSSSSACI